MDEGVVRDVIHRAGSLRYKEVSFKPKTKTFVLRNVNFEIS